MSARRGRQRSAGRNALVLVAGMFFASGGIRLADGNWPALAMATTGAEPVQTPEAPLVQSCEVSPAALAAALSEREARLLARETALSDRSAAVNLAEDALRGRLEALAAAEQELRRTIAMADGAAEEDLARLTTVYEAMKPKDAAALFDAMDAGFAAGFFGRMRAEAAAMILAGMAPDKAYAVSAILAGRNAKAPKG